MTKKLGIVAVLIAVGIAVAGCGANAPELAVTSAPPVSSETPRPSPTPTVEAERGTRANPLAIGELRKISAASMWNVGAAAATQVSDGYVVLPLTIGFDWEAARSQFEAAGGNIDDVGVDPWDSLIVEYVTSGGRTFDTMENFNVDVPNRIHDVGSVFPPTESVTANIPVSVPNEEITGGTWVVRNSMGETVFIASQ